MEVGDHLGDIVSGIPPDMEVNDNLDDIVSGISSDTEVKDNLRWHCQWNPTIYGGQWSFEETLSVESHQIWKSRTIWVDIVSGISPDMEIKDHLKRHCQWNPTRYGGQGSFRWHCQRNLTTYGGEGSFEETQSVESHQIWRSRIIWDDIVSGIPPDMEVEDHLGGNASGIPPDMDVNDHLGDIVSGISPHMEVKDHLRRHCQRNPTRYGGEGLFRWHCQWNPTS